MSSTAVAVEPTEPAYPTHRRVIELSAVLIGVTVCTFVYPIVRPEFWLPSLILTGIVLGYMVVTLFRVPGAAGRWGLVVPTRQPLEMRRAWYWIAASSLAALLPIFAMRWAARNEYIALPPVAGPLAYFGWCIVQDFVFYSLVQRNLLDVMNRRLAGVLTAALYGLVHYPYGGFMVGTFLIGWCWTEVFAAGRVLWLVTLPHFVLGWLILM